MCGIAGFIHRDSCTATCQEIESKIANLQACRGPEAITSTSSKMGDYNVHLYHQRLRIQDLSTSADQPMSSQTDDGTTIVFNGEIYNFEEMRMKYLPDLIMKTHSDTEILVESLVNNSAIDVLGDIRGMFAFGKIDIAQNELILARDRFGEKPLHYFTNDQSIIFASQFDSIVDSMRILGEDIELDQESIYKYLIYGYFPNDSSLVCGVKKLSPGALLTVKFSENLHFNLERWVSEWQASSKKAKPFSELENKLTEAISLQLIGDVPIGVFLSGGCDSTLVSALAQKLNNNPIHSFSLGFENANFDESQFALKAASEIGTKHHALTMSAVDAKNILPAVLKAYPEPLGDPSVMPTTFISKIAREKVTVVLTGDGADELFLGYGRYARFMELEKLHKVKLPFIPNVLRLATPFVPKRIKSRFARLISILSSEDKGLTYGSLVGFPHIDSVIDSETFARVRADSLTHLWNLGFARNSIDRLREIDVQSYLRDDILVKVDRAAMTFALETRAPFLDPEVSLIAQSADDNWLWSGAQKNVIKNILGQYVSKDIFMRKKMGFGAPLGDWFRTELSSWVETTINECDWDSIGIQAEFVRRLWDENLRLDDSNVTYFWMLLVLGYQVTQIKK